MLPSYYPLSGAQASAYDALAAPILAGISTGDDPVQATNSIPSPSPNHIALNLAPTLKITWP